MQRVIMHVDFNSYFASCEQQDNLAWRGKPLGVCEHLGGIIIAASIEAKRWGIKTGTPVWEAKRLYPSIILTKTRPSSYRFYTAKFLKVLSDYTDHIEKYSIDEAFLDVTKASNIRTKNLKGGGSWEKADPFVEAENIAREIKRRITKEVGDYLTCSVGVGWNKLVAKICSDMKKPDGLVVVRPWEKEVLYKKLKLTDIPGIAKRQERNLKELGINTLLDLRDYPLQRLVARFGVMGFHLHKMGQLEGSFSEGFSGLETIKSMGHVYTLPKDYRKEKMAKQVLYKLCEMVGSRLRKNRLFGNVVYVHLWDGENYYGKSRKLGYFIEDGRDIFLEASSILSSIFLENLQVLGELGFKQRASGKWPIGVRQVGVTVSGLRSTQNQLSLFDFYEKKKRVVLAMDKINQKYEGRERLIGKQTSKLGDAHEGNNKGWVIARVPAFLAKDSIRDSIGFGRMNEFKVGKK